MAILDYVKKYPLQIILALIILSVLFIMMGHQWRDTIQKPLKKSFLTLPEATFDGWSFLHFMLFGVFGFIQPGKFFHFFALGAAWELTEDFLAADNVTQVVDCTDPHVTNPKGEVHRKFWCNGVQTDYWYGKWDDLLANSLGYLVGQLARRYVDFKYDGIEPPKPWWNDGSLR